MPENHKKISYTIGIDPGTEKSALVIVNSDLKVVEKLLLPNPEIESFLSKDAANSYPEAELAIEFIQSYGMAVGQETFITVRWIGRFERAFDFGEKAYKKMVYHYARPTIKAHVCSGVGKVKDKHIRQALILRLGGPKKGEPLEGIKSHLWAALAVAVTHVDTSLLGSEVWMKI